MSRGYKEEPNLKPVIIGNGIGAYQNGREAVLVFEGEERPLDELEQKRYAFYQWRLNDAWKEYDKEMEQK